ncbi:MAG: paraquat-inducible protein A [Cohaesibacter sp.]|nr:paraquat-inducible protein A [Cohaesibacter sp.]
MLAGVAFSFGLGVTMPLVSLDKLLFFTETPSLLSILWGLWGDGEPLLAAIVAIFSLAFPALKIMLLHYAAYKGSAGRSGRSRSLSLLSLTSKWSMMDVLLVALVVFSAKTSGLAAASVLPGLWFYASATLGSAVAAVLIKK